MIRGGRASQDTTTTREPQTTPTPGGLVPGSVLARALFAVLSGQRVVVIPSPPGAGKTTLVVDLVARLVQHSDMTIQVLTPTNAGGVNVANLLRTKFDTDVPEGRRVRVSASKNIANQLAHGIPQSGATRVSVSTLASESMRSAASRGTVDVTIVDEAYQSALADVLQTVANSRQVVMVGDPGQIGPVVTANTSPWAHLGDLGPHCAAPHVFAARPDAVVLELDTTYRLGQTTVDVIAPLYSFPFTSSRPHIELVVDGVAVPELATIEVDDPDTPHDMAVMRRAVERALTLIGGTVRQGDATRTLTSNDVAIVVSHNAQVSAINALLSTAYSTYGVKADFVTVGTADSLQGGQWLAVVTVDPLLGHPQGSPHSQSTGRLCVMLSRHIAHLTVVHSPTWADALAEQDGANNQERELGRTVRTRLFRHSTPTSAGMVK